MLESGGFLKYRAESLGIGGNLGSIAEQLCFKMKKQLKPIAEEGRLTRWNLAEK